MGRLLAFGELPKYSGSFPIAVAFREFKKKYPGRVKW
jgi:hypothetical protein